MNSDFIMAGLPYEWLSWLGQPLLYDGGLCVTRSLEEKEYVAKHYGNTPLEI
jgi:hypothetical protein